MRHLSLGSAVFALALVFSLAAPAQIARAEPYQPAATDAALPATSLSGTLWRAQIISNDGSPTETWTIEFRPSGVLHYVYADGRAFDNGRWRQRGAILFWDTNDMFSSGLGLIRGREIHGNRVNVRGLEGSFIFTKAK